MSLYPLAPALPRQFVRPLVAEVGAARPHQHGPLHRQACGSAGRLCLALLGLLGAGDAGAEGASPVQALAAQSPDRGPPASTLPDALASELKRLAQAAAAIVWGDSQPQPRIEVVLGRLDPRLKLAPCQRIRPYLPAGTRPLGRTRMGLRCDQGTTPWNVSLPITVHLWGSALVASTALPAGTVLAARHLLAAEVDLAERADPAISDGPQALGRTLARGLAAGESLRRGDLKTRQWFNSGDTVRIVAVGAGYAVSSEGQALGPGLEGQTARVRTESGRIVTGVAAGEHRVEVAL